MRSPKFRMWHNETKEYVDSADYVLNPANGEVIETSGGEMMAVRPDIVLEQYTGLKDANGVEICDGDIVTVVSQYWGQLGNRYAVKFESGAFSVPTALLSDIQASVIVVGNIHEHADLLNRQRN